MNRSREHELKMIQLLTQSNLGSASFQQPPFQAMHHSETAQYAEGGPMTADYNQQWCRVFVPNVSNIGQDCQRGPSGLSPQHITCHQLRMKTFVTEMYIIFSKTGTHFIW